MEIEDIVEAEKFTHALDLNKTWDKNLFVSAMPIECYGITPNQDDLIKMGWITYLEYEAFSEFYKNVPNKKKPEFNTQYLPDLHIT